MTSPSQRIEPAAANPEDLRVLNEGAVVESASPAGRGVQARPEPSAVRLILTLGLAGFFSGLILVLVYLATAPAIERNRIAALERAVLQVLPGAERFETFVERGDEVVRHDGTAGQPSGRAVFGAFDGDGNPVGFAIPGSGAGFADTLEILIGWDPEGRRVVGMAVLETRETPGLGDKIITDPAFTSSFESLALEPPAVLVAPGARAAENEVDGISGATISAQAIVNIVNAAVGAWDGRLPDLTESSTPAGDEASGGASEMKDRP